MSRRTNPEDLMEGVKEEKIIRDLAAGAKEEINMEKTSHIIEEIM
jgi:hypothetical protein